MPCPRPRWFRWWLFPVTDLVHSADELFAGGGLYTWVTHIGGSRISMTRFVSATVVGVVSITIAAWLARKRYDWLLFALAALIVANALSHLAGTLVIRSYSPGTVSGLVLWLPLGVAVLYRGFARNCVAVWCLGLAVGIAMNAAIVVLTINLGRMP